MRCEVSDSGVAGDLDVLGCDAVLGEWVPVF